MANFSFKVVAFAFNDALSIFALILTEEAEDSMLPHCGPFLLWRLVIDLDVVDLLSAWMSCLSHLSAFSVCFMTFLIHSSHFKKKSYIALLLGSNQLSWLSKNSSSVIDCCKSEFRSQKSWCKAQKSTHILFFTVSTFASSSINCSICFTMLISWDSSYLRAWTCLFLFFYSLLCHFCCPIFTVPFIHDKQKFPHLISKNVKHCRNYLYPQNTFHFIIQLNYVLFSYNWRTHQHHYAVLLC